MPSTQPSPVGPLWLRTSVCAACALSPLIVLVVLVAGSAPPWAYLCMPIVTFWSVQELHGLLTGRPPKSRLAMGLDVLRGRARAESDRK